MQILSLAVFCDGKAKFLISWLEGYL
jgi:hypothetical protein